MKKGLVVSFLLIVCLVLSACNSFSSKDASSGSGTEGTSGGSKKSDDTLNLYFDNDIPDLNPIKTTDSISFSVLGNVMEGLYRLDENNKPVPAMAKSVKVSDDGLTYTFTLRDGIKWSNGEPVTAQDFVDGWLLGMNPQTSGSYRFILTDYIVNGEEYTNGKVKADKVGVEAPDDKTFIVHIKKPTPYFLGLTTFEKYYPVNKAFFEKNKDDFGQSPDKLLYNGPYVLTDFNPASGVTLKKNDQYWDKANVNIPNIDIKVIKEASTALNLYNGGQLDYVNLSSEDVNNYKDKPEFGTQTNFRSYYVQFNLGDSVLKNKSLRQALQLSYDPSTLEKVILNNGSKAASGLIPPGMEGVDGKSFRDLQGDVIKPDVAKAKDLWKEGIKELGKTPKLQLLVSDDTVEKDTATFLQSQWKKNLGIDVELVTKPYSGRLDTMRAGDYQMAISAWGADYNDPMTYMDLWVSPATPFRGSFSNKEYDQLIKDAKSQSDDTKRMNELLKTEQILLKDEAVLAPLYYQGQAYLQNPKVKGLVFHPWGNPWDYKYATMD
ncbi:oligopeptide transport system substrate-binding protein [Pullulanibacillus pueri]|uniref:Peptide ABC transporter substrate-binding protein n=1 Tax=Pullulanibacillus pueri TaxID=1437324 RepID=A0A8J2ZXJ7_9BACL|nr:peptide ABC transporter substrate-binding protein [Pullulanibacillus pueri]MBM7682858.1 oligopeptide transport system substrate-binding protein [Pullulanibacillus pueri]GGH84308.1 peptide ABC transporter substrate-binding protein [Pullulanibacillus pueri]